MIRLDQYIRLKKVLGSIGAKNKKINKAHFIGFRNILVRDYLEIDFSKVYKHLKEDLKDFNHFAKLISIFLNC